MIRLLRDRRQCVFPPLRRAFAALILFTQLPFFFSTEIFTVPSAHAATGIYKPMAYQGKVQTSAGPAVADGQYNVRFKIFGTPSGGDALWTETWNQTTERVTMTGGLFSALLGSKVTMTGSVNFNDDSLYLQVEFDPGNDGTYEEIFSPRRRFAAVPYAHNADKVDGLDAAQFLRSDVAATANGAFVVYAGTLAASGSIRTEADLTINQDADTNNAIVTFGSDGTNESFTWLNAEDRFELSDDLRVTGGTYASGALIVDGAALFKSTLKLNGVTYTFPASDGTASGKVLKTNAAGQLAWSADQTGAGSGLAYGDIVGSFVNQSGDTMTGALILNGANVGLTASGQIRAGGAMLASGNLVIGTTARVKSDIYSSGALVVHSNVKTRADLTINADNAAADAVVTFGSDGTSETLKFLNAEDRFEFSDDLNVLGALTTSGALVIGGTTVLKGTVKLNGVNYTFPTSDGSASGKVLKTNAAGQLAWSADQTGGGGGSLQGAYDSGNAIETLTNSVIIQENSAAAHTLDLLQLTANPATTGTFAGDIAQITIDAADANAFTGNGLHFIVDDSQMSAAANVIKVESDTGQELFAVSQFGFARSNRGFVSYDAYMQQDFNDEKANATADNATWGDDQSWMVDESASPAGVCTFSTPEAATGEVGFIRAASAAAGGCFAYMGLAAGDIRQFTKVTSLPRTLMKIRPSRAAADGDTWAGLFIDSTSTNTEPTEGIYFTNADGANWVGRVNPASGSNTDVACGVAISTTQFALTEIIVESSTLVRFRVDPDISNGISFTECGTANPSGVTNNLGVGVFLGTTVATAFNLDTDYVRIWTDDPPDGSGGGGDAAPSGDAPLDLIANADIAEAFPAITPERLQPGDLVSLAGGGAAVVRKTEQPYEPLLLGVVSTSPKDVLGEQGSTTVHVSLAGRAPVTVSTENGPIAAGDYLTSSSVPGVAMKASRPGPVIGQALEEYDGEDIGQILFFVRSSAREENGFTLLRNTGGLIDHLEARAPLAIVTEDARRPLFELITGETDGSKDVLRIATGRVEEQRTTFRVNASGSVFTDGTFNSSGADYAEWFSSADTGLRPGELVCIDVTRANTVKRCAPGDANLMGIVSTNPAFIGNAIGGAEGLPVPGTVLVGLIGQVPARAVVEEGMAIRPGDALTSSEMPGMARRARAGEATVGVALEGLATGEGVINVLIARKNESLTVDAVEERVLQTIAAMEIGDETQILLANAIQDPAFQLLLADEVRRQMDILNEAGDHVDHAAASPALFSGAAVAVASGEQAHPPAPIAMQNVLHVLGEATFSGSLRALAGATMTTLEVQETLTVGGNARIGNDLTIDGTLSASRITSPSSLYVDGDLILPGTIHASSLKLPDDAVLDLGGLTVHGTLRAEDIVLGSGSLSLESLLVRGALEIVGDVTISGIARFLSDVEIGGHLSVSNRQAGYLVIPRTGTSATVVFDPPWPMAPIVQVMPHGISSSPWYATVATNTGFSVVLRDPSAADLRFSWIVLGVTEPLITEGHASAPEAGLLPSIPFPVDGAGVPLSSDPVWNACIRGFVTLDDTGRPLSCRHHEDLWEHPDLGISFTWDRTASPPLLKLPEGFAPTMITLPEVDSEADPALSEGDEDATAPADPPEAAIPQPAEPTSVSDETSASSTAVNDDASSSSSSSSETPTESASSTDALSNDEPTEAPPFESSSSESPAASESDASSSAQSSDPEASSTEAIESSE